METIPSCLRILVPSCALQADTCLLIGWRHQMNGICCITNYITLSEPCSGLPSQIKEFCSNGSENLQILGIWENAMIDVDTNLWKSYLKIAQSQRSWLHMRKDNSDLPQCNLQGEWQHSFPSSNIITLVFDADDMAASDLLEMHSPSSNIGYLSHTLEVGRKMIVKSCESYVDGETVLNVESFIPFDCSWIRRHLHAVEHCVIHIFLLLAAVITSICDNRLTQSSFCQYLPLPATVQNLKHRARRVHTSIQHGKQTKLDRMRMINVLWHQGIDMLLGILVLYYLVTGDHPEFLAKSLMVWAQTVASRLHDLLQWMMGVPAGLKLNHELAHFLGEFFLYHIYLWKGYLQFLTPWWPDAVWCVALSGCLGVSFQLSFVQDLLSMMTLHSYCFYVYAARLYSLQVYGLVSLWRLFRGKKWNPLFQRVDSSSYDVDQLFIGTLLFTILLFLLPTVGLFYIVFTGLRLLVLTIQGLIYKSISFLDSIPVYSLLLRLFQSRKVAGDVRMHVLPNLPGRPLYYALQLLPVPVSKLFQLVDIPTSGSAPPPYSWGNLFNKVLSGHLVYPWMESNNKL